MNLLESKWANNLQSLFEPRQDKTNKMAVRTAKTQIAVRMKKPSVLSYPLSASKDSDESSPWRTVTFKLLVLPCRSLFLCDIFLFISFACYVSVCVNLCE